MAQDGLPDEMATLVVNTAEKIMVNLYPNALCNVKRALKAHLDERIGKYCSKNNGILLSYTDMRFRAKYFQVFEDYPVCRFPVSITATYYKPDPGTIATGTITRVDHISVTCLIHGMIHVTIALRKSVNFDTWCAPGQQIIFQIRGGEMHYKGVRLNAIVTDECVDRMRIAFPPKTVGSRKRTLSSSSADSSMITPQKKFPSGETSAGKSAKLNHKRKIKRSEMDDSFDKVDELYGFDAYENEGDHEQDCIDFGTPSLTSTQIKPNKSYAYKFVGIDDDNQGIVNSPSDDDDGSPVKRIKVEYSSQEETTPVRASKKRSKKKHTIMPVMDDNCDF